MKDKECKNNPMYNNNPYYVNFCFGLIIRVVVIVVAALIFWCNI
jgi:hypothetical protein